MFDVIFENCEKLKILLFMFFWVFYFLVNVCIILFFCKYLKRKEINWKEEFLFKNMYG